MAMRVAKRPAVIIGANCYPEHPFDLEFLRLSSDVSLGWLGDEKE